ncbi:hypothetical protein Clacol_002725 [Clathrus columnatus]|uniref:NADP-dependent oxidoreductase domain-containing protein n=1 Tax=Clathrus columnatus TaxID=1419009 RepID=A0AAV5A1K0_9AGAM|nr:hypothetical protein Clacol_002725 [Clathrus columnatus]
MSFNEAFTLSNDAKIPQVGFGTWLSKPHEVETAVELAVKHGYRHLDFAHIYENQKEVGAALKKVIPSVVNREDLFITSKLWNSSHQPHLVEEELDITLSDLGLDYLDLYFELDLKTTLVDTWKAMIALPKNKVRAIGVSNFSVEHIEAIIKATGVVPVVNQVELHPRLAQDELIKYCASKNIHVTAYSPLGNNSRNEPLFTENEIIKRVANRLNATPAQVLIAWAVQRGTSVLPKTVTPSRIIENFQQITLSKEDVEEIGLLAKSPIRYNIPALVNKPRWDIDIFGDETEKTATHKINIQ